MTKIRLTLASVLLLLGASPLIAQDERGFFVGNFGFTFAENTAGSYGATAGVNITRDLQIVGT